VGPWWKAFKGTRHHNNQQHGMTMRVVMSRFPLKKSQRQKHDLVTVTKTAFLVAKELSITTVCSGSLIYLLDQ
jgi:hypothetical protein